MIKKIYEIQSTDELAILVGVDLRSEKQFLTMEDSLEELSLLAKTAGLEICCETTQRLEKPNPETLIGGGKVDEIKILLDETGAKICVFDIELNPRHQRELEKKLGENIRVLDRTALILDIFAQHAKTREGILQVELAQYEYRLPRLTRAWTHLARQAGGASGRSGSTGGVGLRGPGETQLEVDRREINTRISALKKDLEKVREHRLRHRVQRKRSRIPIVSLVGYTNAGKSTLLNQISGADIYTADQLFATLDPTTRRVELPAGEQILITDTVGFIQKLPTQLVAAFRATLEEISESDLLIHVVDINHPNALAQWKAVQNTLTEINADHIPVITALNKIDLLPDPDNAIDTLKSFQNSVAISANTRFGLPELLESIETNLFKNFIPIDITLPYTEGNLLSQIHDLGMVELIEHNRKGTHVRARIPGRLVASFKPFLKSGDVIDFGSEEVESES
ncbi:MAG: GTPase HflX [Chloroflexi bacterium]|nr:GTPase HflX [Chloroflexota bacterium]